MYRNKVILHVLSILMFVLLPAENHVLAAQHVISADGREVLLEDDGTWRYLSDDRLADTRDGKQVRLKADGSWQYVGNTPLETDTQVRTTYIDFILEKVVIQTHEKKVQKNTRIRTQTVFYIEIQVSSQSKNNIKINSDIIDNINIKDNKGNKYEILSVTPHAVVEPGNSRLISLRADKSPSIWDDVKSMQVVFQKGIFDIPQEITLSQKIIDFEREKVDSFEY